MQSVLNYSYLFINFWYQNIWVLSSLKSDISFSRKYIFVNVTCVRQWEIYYSLFSFLYWSKGLSELLRKYKTWVWKWSEFVKLLTFVTSIKYKNWRLFLSFFDYICIINLTLRHVCLIWKYRVDATCQCKLSWHSVSDMNSVERYADSQLLLSIQERIRLSF